MSASPPASREPSPESSAGPEALASALRSLIWVLWLALLGLVGIYVTSGFTFVAPGENALVLRLGRLLPEVHPPGLLLAWPRPIDTVLRVPGGQVLELEIAAWAPTAATAEPGQPLPRAAFHPGRHGYTLTGDRNILQGLFTLRYRVTNPAAYALGVQNPEHGLREIVLQALTQELSEVRVDAVLVEERQALAVRARDRAQVAANQLELGVELMALEIRELVPPVWVASAFAEVVNARIEADTLIQGAWDERARRLPEAEAAAFRLREEARAQARDRVRQARAEALAFQEIRRAAEENLPLFLTRRHGETLAMVRPRLRSTTVLAPQTPPAALWLQPNARTVLEPLLSDPGAGADGSLILPGPVAPSTPGAGALLEELPPDPAAALEEFSGNFEAWEEVPLPTWQSRDEP